MSAEAGAFEPVNRVEQQLIAAATGDKSQQKAFERFILDEILYAATPEAQPEGSFVAEAGTSLALITIRLEDGRIATPVFTSPHRIHETFGEVGSVGIQGRVLFEMIRANPAWLNPGHAYGVLWEPETLSGLIGLPVQRVIKEATQITLGSPANPPHDLVGRLKTALAAVPQVEAAWLALALWPATQEEAWYLDVRTSSADHEPIRRALPAAVDGADMQDKVLDMVINPAGRDEGVGIPIVERSNSGPRPTPSADRKSWLKRLLG
jgi:hypothetical protein